MPHFSPVHPVIHSQKILAADNSLLHCPRPLHFNTWHSDNSATERSILMWNNLMACWSVLCKFDWASHSFCIFAMIYAYLSKSLDPGHTEWNCIGRDARFDYTTGSHHTFIKPKQVGCQWSYSGVLHCSKRAVAANNRLTNEIVDYPYTYTWSTDLTYQLLLSSAGLC